MITLESITPGLVLEGIEPTEVVAVVATVPLAEGAVQVIYKTQNGTLKDRLLNRIDEASIGIATVSGRGPSTAMAKPSNSPWRRSASTSPSSSIR
jgi:hypothetical protein